MTAQIEQIIQKGLEEKTFSLEIIDHIKNLKDDCGAMIEKTKQQAKKIEDLTKENTTLSHDLNDTRAKLVSFKEREANLIEREKNADRNDTRAKLVSFKEREANLIEREKNADRKDYELNFQTQRANEIKELFGTVFRNPVILRNKVVGHVGEPQYQGGYPSITSVNDSETETIQ